MPTFYSAQMTKFRAKPIQPLDTNEWGGEVRAAYFSFTGDVAQNDVVELAVLPVGARVLRGRVDFSDFGTSVTLDIGDEITENKYLSAIDVATTAGQADFAHTAARGMGSVVTPAASPKYPGFVTIQAKFENANPDNGTLTGYILYVVN